MESIIQKIKIVFSDKTLRNRIFFTLFALAVFRALAVVPMPFVNSEALRSLIDSNEFFNLLNIFSGGGFSDQLSIVALGVGPYITSSIIMQLLTIMSPRIKEMHSEEGEVGRAKYNQISRVVTVPLAFIQSFSLLYLLKSQGILMLESGFDFAIAMLVITAGSMLLMWIGEVVTEFGIGNGMSMIIFAGIISAVPQQLSILVTQYDPSNIPTYIAFVLVTLFTIWAVVIVTESERHIPITYSRDARGGSSITGGKSYLPLRINQGGVIPIIFALSILLFPQMISKFLVDSQNVVIAKVAGIVSDILSNQLVYGLIYFFLVIFFTYFYTAISFEPKKIAENLQKGGAYVSGVRPGESTSSYLASIVTRITLFGSVFLALIAVLPILIQYITDISSIAVGGTALLIVVSVVIDLIKKIDAQVSMREY